MDRLKQRSLCGENFQNVKYIYGQVKTEVIMRRKFPKCKIYIYDD